jgi:hypothetical protein
MTDHPYRPHLMTVIKCIIVATLLYQLAIGPLAFLRGAGVLDDKAVDSIRPIYAPMRNFPGVGLLVGYERQSDALGRRFHK